MCECACGDFSATHKLAGPAGVVYAIDVYAGCNECNTGVAVIIHRFSVVEAERWGVPELPDLPFSKGEEHGLQESWLPIWHPKRLVDALWNRLADPLVKLFKKDRKLSEAFPEGEEIERMILENFESTRAEAKKGGWM